MSFILALLYAVVAIYVIWWALSGAKKLEAGHGDHNHEQPQDNLQENAQPATPRDADDLTQIKGIGAVITARLRTLGITTYEQIAALNDTDIEKINQALNFKGRIEREQWIQQAQELLAKRS